MLNCVGGVISPILANVYLHEVLDEWFDRDVRPRLRGRALLVRYADDFVVAFSREDDARRVMQVLPKRFGGYGLTLHPDKTRLVRFDRPRRGPDGEDDEDRPGSFDLLGFTHYWGRSYKGAWVIKRRTMSSRLSRALGRVNQWCRLHRHLAVAEQRKALGRKLRGHFEYYGITGNFEGLQRFAHEVARIWKKWLDRRSQRGRMTWEQFIRLRARHSLPPPRVAHSIYRRSANA